MASLLQLVNIDRRYLDSDKPLVILEKANFSLEQGQTVALVAPSGAGKSTLLHIAGLLERPNGGDVVLRGHSCSNLSDNDRTAIRRNDIGFVYQFHHLLPEFTALENVMIPQMIAGLKRSEAADRGLKLLTYLTCGASRQTSAIRAFRWRAATCCYCPGSCQCTFNSVGG